MTYCLHAEDPDRQVTVKCSGLLMPLCVHSNKASVVLMLVAVRFIGGLGGPAKNSFSPKCKFLMTNLLLDGCPV